MNTLYKDLDTVNSQFVVFVPVESCFYQVYCGVISLIFINGDDDSVSAKVTGRNTGKVGAQTQIQRRSRSHLNSYSW